MLKGRFERLFLKGILWLCLALLAFFAVFLAGSVWDVRGKEQIARQEKENARQAYEELKARQTNLSQSVALLQSERGIEEEIRKRFPVAKRGEEVIVLVDAPKTSNGDAPQAPRGLWGALFRWLGITRGISLVAERDLPKVEAGFRLPHPAQKQRAGPECVRRFALPASVIDCND